MTATPAPVFAPVELARRIDRAEARLTAELGRVMVGRDASGAAFVEEIAGGVAAFTGPSSPANKMIGVGFDGLPEPAALDGVEEKFAARATPLQAEVATLAEPALASTLTRRGYVLQGFENVLGRRLLADDAVVRPPGGFELRLVEPAETEAWLEVSVVSFSSPDLQGIAAEPLPPRETLEGVLRPFAEVPGFRRYGAFVGGRMVGAASLRLDDGLAQLCGASTLPEFRRRGIQTAFLHRRLADAVEAGCDLALVTTQPGSKSQENAHRQGFGLLYCRALLVKPPS